MVIKNYELLNIYTALNTLITQKLPVSVGWNLGKNNKIIKSVLEDFLKAEQALVAEYAIKKGDNVVYDDNGQPEIKPKYKDVFIKEHSELLNCESELDLLTVDLNSILYTYVNGKKVEREIEPSLLLALDVIINDLC